MQPPFTVTLETATQASLQPPFTVFIVKSLLSGHSKRIPKLVFKTDYFFYFRSRVLRNAQREHFAIRSTCIKLPSVLKTFTFPIFKWRFKTGLKLHAW